MSVKNLYSALIVLSFIVAGCHSDETPEIKEPPRFTLAEIKNYKSGGRISKAAAGEPNVAFNLGDIKLSKEYFFLLANGGDDPIYNIKLTTNTPGFEVYPKGINILNGKKSAESTIIPLVSIGIEHGKKLNGVGYADALKMNLNTTTLTLTGKAFQNGDSVEIKSEFDLTVNAKIMDISLYADEQEVDLTKPYSEQGIVQQGALTAPSICIIPSLAHFKIKNSGNVDVNLILEYHGMESIINMTPIVETMQVSLTPGSIQADIFSSKDSNISGSVYITVVGDGTITNPNRIYQASDGKGYLRATIMR